jgi:hypothetical protein
MEGVMSEEHQIAEVTIAVPRALVWQALREPGEIGCWFGWDADTLAGEIKDIFIDNAEADAASGTLQFSEWEGVSDRFELEERDGKTVVRIVRRGPVPAGGWGEVYDEVVEGWISFLQQLRLYLERHRYDARRTLRFSTDAGPGVIEAVGMIGAGGSGTHFIRELSTGDRITGELWHWSRHQVGVTVEDWGGGLLIVTDRPQGGGSALLTTYGLDDVTFAGLETRWRTWWETMYP